MNNSLVVGLVTFGMCAFAADPILIPRAQKDAKPEPNPSSSFWKRALVSSIERGPKGEATPLPPTILRALWTPQYLYVHFSCPYQTLYLKPEPVLDRDTVPLWDWDVVEVFIGSDFSNIRRYKEYEVSPQNEWVDLDIRKDENVYDWKWNSGMESQVTVDKEKKVWNCAMRIPWKSVDERKVEAGREYRANFYRIEGAKPNRIFLAWRPTGNPSYHTPEAFGVLKLAK